MQDEGTYVILDLPTAPKAATIVEVGLVLISKRLHRKVLGVSLTRMRDPLTRNIIHRNDPIELEVRQAGSMLCSDLWNIPQVL